MPENDERVAAGITALAHLQGAALEVIAALRATLDVAEDLVRDPSFVVGMVGPLLAPRPSPTPDAPDQGPVEHIRIS